MTKSLLTILFLLISTIALYGCSDDAEKRVRETFGIPKNTSLTELNIREAVVKKIPLGANEGEIYRIFKELRIGVDGLSSFYPANEKGQIICRFEYNPKGFGFVKKHYGITFQLDDKHILKDVTVREWLTGL